MICHDACALLLASLVGETFLIAARCIPCPRVTSLEAEAWRLSVVKNTPRSNQYMCSESSSDQSHFAHVVILNVGRVGRAKKLLADGSSVPCYGFSRVLIVHFCYQFLANFVLR